MSREIHFLSVISVFKAVGTATGSAFARIAELKNVNIHTNLPHIDRYGPTERPAETCPDANEIRLLRFCSGGDGGEPSAFRRQVDFPPLMSRRQAL